MDKEGGKGGMDGYKSRETTETVRRERSCHL